MLVTTTTSSGFLLGEWRGHPTLPLPPDCTSRQLQSKPRLLLAPFQRESLVRCRSLLLVFIFLVFYFCFIFDLICFVLFCFISFSRSDHLAKHLEDRWEDEDLQRLVRELKVQVRKQGIESRRRDSEAAESVRFREHTQGAM